MYIVKISIQFNSIQIQFNSKFNSKIQAEGVINCETDSSQAKPEERSTIL